MTSKGRVLVLGDYRQTVTVVRSLGRAGFHVCLGCPDPHSSTALSRYVDDVWVYDPSSGAERFAASVEAYVLAHRPEFVFTVGESELRHLLDALPRLETLSTWANPDPAVIARCFDKRGMYRLAVELGIPTAPWRPYVAGEWPQAAKAMGFPVVVKRKDSAGLLHDKKAVILQDEAELDALLAAVAGEEPDSLLLQKFAPGARHNCQVAVAHGRIVAYFQQKVLETDEPDGTGIGTAGVSVRPSLLLFDYCVRLVRELRYTGIGCIQFLVDDESGKASFLEFNARMDSTAALPYRLGYDFPRLAIELAALRNLRMIDWKTIPGAPREDYATGRSYQSLYADVNAWIGMAKKRKRTPIQLLAWAIRILWRAARSHHLIFDWRDPLPALDLFWQRFGVRWLRRGQAWLLLLFTARRDA